MYIYTYIHVFMYICMYIYFYLFMYISNFILHYSVGSYICPNTSWYGLSGVHPQLEISIMSAALRRYILFLCSSSLPFSLESSTLYSLSLLVALCAFSSPPPSRTTLTHSHRSVTTRHNNFSNSNNRPHT